MIRQCLTKTANTHGPCARFCYGVFELATYLKFSNIPAPTFTTATTLVTKTADIIAFFAAQVTVPRNVNAVSPSAEIVFIFKPFYCARSAYAQVVVHYIMTQFAAAAA